MITRGCVALSLTFVLIALMLVFGFSSILRSFADWRIAKEQTTQIQIKEDGATMRTQIEWDGRIAVAHEQASAVKESSWPYLFLWIVRFAAGAITVIAVALVVKLFYTKRGQYGL